MRPWAAAATAAGLVALCALGASLAAAQGATTTTAVAPTKTTTTPRTSAPRTATPTTATATPTVATIVPVAACRPTALDGVVVEMSGAAGTQYVQFALHDYRGTQCTVKGTPTVTLLGTGGAPLVTHEGRFSATTFAGRAEVARLVLLNSNTTGNVTGRASGWASFTLAHVSGGAIAEPQTACPTTSAIAVGLPGASGTVVVPIPGALRDFGSHYGAPCGSFKVGSFYAGLGPQP